MACRLLCDERGVDDWEYGGVDVGVWEGQWLWGSWNKEGKVGAGYETMNIQDRYLRSV